MHSLSGTYSVLSSASRHLFLFGSLTPAHGKKKCIAEDISKKPPLQTFTDIARVIEHGHDKHLFRSLPRTRCMRTFTKRALTFQGQSTDHVRNESGGNGLTSPVRKLPRTRPLHFQPNDRSRPESYGRRGASPRTGPTQQSSAGWCRAALLLRPPGGTETPGKKLHPRWV